jgi:hypothetical protein
MAPRKVEVAVIANAASFIRGMREGIVATDEFAASMAKTGHTVDEFQRKSKDTTPHLTAMKAAVAGAAIGGFYLLKQSIGEGIRVEEQHQVVAARTATVIKSTGGAANVTAEQVRGLSERLSEQSGQTQEATQASANLLLSFTNIKNSGTHKTFDQAAQAALNLSTAFGKNLNSTTLMVGKALNDPVKGLGALSRAGVQFSSGQKDVIKNLVETGHQAQAQQLVLDALQQKVGDAAAAYGGTTAGQFKRFNNALREIKGGLAEGLMPVLSAFANFITSHQAEITAAFKSIGDVISNIGTAVVTIAGPPLRQLFSFISEHSSVAAALAIALIGVVGAFKAFSAIKEVIATLKEMRIAFAALTVVMELNPFVVIATAIVAAGVAIYELWQHSQTFRNGVLGVWNAIKPFATWIGGVFVSAWNMLKGAITPLVPVFQNVWSIGSTLWGVLKSLFGYISNSPLFGPLVTAAKLLLSPFNLIIASINTIKSGIQWIADHVNPLGKTLPPGTTGSSIIGGGGNQLPGTKASNAFEDGVVGAAKKFGPAMVDSIRQARGNLASMASSIGSQVGQIKSSSYRDPVTGQTVTEMQAAQDKIIHDRRKTELQAAIDGAADDNARAQAQQDMNDFVAQDAINAAQAASEATGKAAQDQVTNWTNAFNAGTLSAADFKKNLTDLIGGDTGSSLGAEFVASFTGNFGDLIKQINALSGAQSVTGEPSNVQTPSGQADVDAWNTKRENFKKALKSAKKSGGGLTSKEEDRLDSDYGAHTLAGWERAHPKPSVSLATGGITLGPNFALIGEAGPEAVIPLSSPAAKKMLSGAGGGGGQIINLTFNGVMNAKDAARMLRPELDRLVRIAV